MSDKTSVINPSLEVTGVLVKPAACEVFIVLSLRETAKQPGSCGDLMEMGLSGEASVHCGQHLGICDWFLGDGGSSRKEL